MDEQGSSEVVQKSTGQALSEALGAGFFGGMVGGLASHYFAAGKMTFPIFMVVWLLILGSVTPGWAKFVSTVVFAVVAAGVVALWGVGPQ